MTDQLLIYGIRLIISFSCGLLLGIERKSRQNAVGIRTLGLISVSCCLLAILSIYVAQTFSTDTGRGDPTRVISTVITGIGFIGGGAILKQGLNIRGLTTAAIILTTAAIGLSCGAGLYGPALITLAIALIVLFIMNKVEKLIFPAVKTKLLHISTSTSDVDTKRIEKILKSNGIIINDVNVEYTSKKDMVELIYTVKTPDKLNPLKLSSELVKIGKLSNFTLSDS
ncbi:MAG: MgtC/SapB family protein [Treponema sp.]|nr:MgtC/SapB family protein [Treponema sp.]